MWKIMYYVTVSVWIKNPGMAYLEAQVSDAEGQRLSLGCNQIIFLRLQLCQSSAGEKSASTFTHV